MQGLKSAPFLMTLGAAFLVVNDAIVKDVAGALPLTQIVALRAAVITAVCGGLIALSGKGFALPLQRDFLLRSGFTIGNVFAFVAAVSVLPFSIAVLLDFTNILFVALFAPLVLGERLTRLKIIAAALGFTGAAIILSAARADFGLLIFLPLLSGALGAGRELWTRRLQHGPGPEVLTFYAAAGMVVIACAIGWQTWLLADPAAIALACLAGVFQAAAMLLMTTALMRGDASLVAPFRLTSLLWVLLIAAFFFGEALAPGQLAGAVLIITALLLTLRSTGRRLRLSN
jgi:drug/metabolite transporter (DMT)-like permease